VQHKYAVANTLLSRAERLTSGKRKEESEKRHLNHTAMVTRITCKHAGGNHRVTLLRQAMAWLFCHIFHDLQKNLKLFKCLQSTTSYQANSENRWYIINLSLCRIRCKDCSLQYLGETKRPLFTRKKRTPAVSRNVMPNAVNAFGGARHHKQT